MLQFQSGFRSCHSTVTALLKATDNWALNIDRGHVNGVVFVDLKEAFDTVNHPILLSKLYWYGVKGNAYELLSSYIDNRTQKCAVNGVLSNSCTLTCGILQGTILVWNHYNLWASFRKVCLIDVTNSSLLRVAPNIFSCVRNNGLSAFEELFLKCTSPVDHSLCSNTKPCCHPLNTFSFGCLGIYSTIPLLLISCDAARTLIDHNLSYATCNRLFMLSSGLHRVKSQFYLLILSLSSYHHPVGKPSLESRLWRWLPHRLLKRPSWTTALLRTPITQMIFFN